MSEQIPTLWEIVERWQEWRLVAVLRCDNGKCGRRLGEVRRGHLNEPALGVVFAGGPGPWETAEGDDPDDPRMLFGANRWARVSWLDDPVPGDRTFRELISAVDNGLVGAGSTQCPKCRRFVGWRLEWVA